MPIVGECLNIVKLCRRHLSMVPRSIATVHDLEPELIGARPRQRVVLGHSVRQVNRPGQHGGRTAVTPEEGQTDGGGQRGSHPVTQRIQLLQIALPQLKLDKYRGH